MTDKKVNLKVMHDLNDKEISVLLEGLKKIEGFEFGIESYVNLTRHDQNA